MAKNKSESENLSLIEWLGFRSDANYANHRTLGGFFGFLLSLVGLLLGLLAIASVFLMVLVVYRLFVSVPEADLGNALRGIAFALGAIVGLPFLVWRSWVAHRQADTAEQGLLTDRFTKAVEQLGSDKVIKVGKDDEKTVPNIEVRLGALYALERISQDSERDHIPIMETICAYVRENTAEPRYTEETCNNLQQHYQKIGHEERKSNPEKTGVSLSYLPPRADIRAALIILGRRSPQRRAHERLKTDAKQAHSLDLRNCQLQHADLSAANFEYANFSESNLQFAQLKYSDFSYAFLANSNLIHCRANHAIFIGAKFSGANMKNARLSNTDMTRAQLYRSNLSKARLYRATITRAKFFRTNLKSAIIRGAVLNGAFLSNTTVTNANFSDSTFFNAQVKDVDFSSCGKINQDQIDQMFANQKTTIQVGMSRPQHWPKTEVGYKEFDMAYQTFLKFPPLTPPKK